MTDWRTDSTLSLIKAQRAETMEKAARHQREAQAGPTRLYRQWHAQLNQHCQQHLRDLARRETAVRAKMRRAG